MAPSKLRMLPLKTRRLSIWNASHDAGNAFGADARRSGVPMPALRLDAATPRSPPGLVGLWEICSCILTSPGLTFAKRENSRIIIGEDRASSGRERPSPHFAELP